MKEEDIGQEVKQGISGVGRMRSYSGKNSQWDEVWREEHLTCGERTCDGLGRWRDTIRLAGESVRCWV